MNNIKSAFILIGLIAVVVGVIYFAPTSTNTVKEIVKEVVEEKAGAIPGNDLASTIKIGGVGLVGLSQNFETGTTSVCSFDLRPYASSSIISLGATVRGVPTTTGLSWKWYRGIGQKSTTTIMAGRAVTATGTSIFATTTIAANDNKWTGSGQNFLVLDFEGGSSPYLAMEGQTGTCDVLLHVPNVQ